MSEMKKKALLAEDTVPIRLVIKTILGKIGYDLTIVDNGVEAVEQALELQPDVILMDIMMPRMDGIQATLKIKSNPKTKHIPVIMLTALKTSDAVLTSYDYGADYYINKPFSNEEIVKAVGFVEKMQKRPV
ncbi:MAG: response regulator [Candidatus Eremiobacterota bacterium]